MIRLYVGGRSGNSHKVALFLSILGLTHETVDVPYGPEMRTPEFLAKNPRGQVPVLEVDGKCVWDSGAILVYLARAYGGERWLPTDPSGMAEVMQWMALAQNEIYFGLQWARGVFVYGKKGDLAEYQMQGRKALDMLERQLKDHDWLALERPTIADIACYPYTKRAPEGEVSLGPYPAVQAWLARCEAIPGWVKLD